MLIAESLKIEKIEPVFVLCDTVLKKNCLCMSVVPYEESGERERICGECRGNRDFLHRRFHSHRILLDSYVLPEERERILKHLRNWDSANLGNYVFQRIQIGKKALYEFILKYKLLGDVIPPERKEEFLVNLYNAALVATAMERILAEVQPAMLLLYNSFYSTNQVVAEIASIRKIPVFSVHAGTHHLYRNRIITLQKVTVASGSNATDPPYPEKIPSLNPAQLPMIEEHIQGLFEARTVWVYSPKARRESVCEIREKMAISSRQKVILAALRSDDERSAADLSLGLGTERRPLFQDQFLWMNWLSEFAKKNPELTVVVRQHPREVANRREKVISANHSRLDQWVARRQVPENMIFNRPEHGVSLYDLFKITDVLLRNSSSVGSEAALYGIPVVGMGDDTAFDPALQAESRTLEEYEKNIQVALQSGWKLQQVYLAYRWFHYLFVHREIDVRDGWDNSKTPFFRLKKKWAKSRAKFFQSGFVDSSYTLRRLRRPLAQHERLMEILLGRPWTDNSRKGGSAGMQTNFELVRATYRKTMGWLSGKRDDEFQVKVEGVCSQTVSPEDHLIF